MNWVGLAICRSAPNQNHVGILFREDGIGAQLCHLAWHHKLTFSSPDPNKYRWIDVNELSDLDRESFAAWMIVLREEDPVVPYGYSIDGDFFDENGQFIPPPTGRGLTCATWVLATFRQLGYRMLEIESWPPRDEDEEWQRHILEALKQSGASVDHVEALHDEIGSARIKPQEVVAGGLGQDWPSSFDEIVELAVQIDAELDD